MTFSAPPLSPEGFQHLRAHLTYAVCEEPDTRGPGGLRARMPRASLLVLGGVAASLAILLVVIAFDRADPSPPPVATVVPVAAAPAAPAWTDVIRPFTAYDVAGGAFGKLPMTYAARRDAAGTARQDTLTYGTPLPGEPFLRLMVYRRGAELVADATVFVDAARLAAGAGLAVTRSGLASTLKTRFGAVEVAGVKVDRLQRSASCLAFRFVDPATAAVLQVTGLACGSDERPIDLATLACTIEKVDLVSAGDDEDLRAVFVAAERRRGIGCREEHAALRPGLPDEEQPVRGTFKGPL
jgi:hypothetical protein